MKSKLTLLILAAFFPAALTVSAQEKKADEGDSPIYLKATDTKELRSKEGQKVIVYGTTSGSGKAGSGMNFVNFDGAEFYLVTFKSDLVEFEDGEPADIYDGKKLAVTGVVSIYRDKVQIKLTSPDQVQILKEDEVFPPKSAAKPVETAKKAEPEKPTAPATTEKTEEPKKKPPVDPKRFFK